MLTFFLISFLIGLSHQRCSDADDEKFKGCQPLYTEVTAQTDKNLKIIQSLPDPAVFDEFTSLCNKALNCTDTIDCDEVQFEALVVRTACQKVAEAASALPCAKKILDVIPASESQYMCVIHNNSSLNDRNLMCKVLHSKEEICVRRAADEICGIEESKRFKDNKRKLRSLLDCPLKFF